MPAKNKTTETEHSVEDYLNAISDEQKREDCIAITKIFRKASGFKPKMWGPAIVGFGTYHYKYDSGREGDAPLTGFAARANGISLYLSSVYENRDELMSEFGKCKAGKGCITIKKLEDVDQKALSKMITNSVEYYKQKYS